MVLVRVSLLISSTYLKMFSIWESKCFLYILKAKCLLCDSRRQKICSESDSKKKSELSVFVKNGVEGFFSTWYTYYIICAYFEIGFFFTDLRSSFWHSEELHKIIFSKFYGKVGIIPWFLFHLIWKNYVLSWDFDLKSWIVDFFTCFTREKAPQNNFSSQNFSVENSHLPLFTHLYSFTVYK